MKIYFRFFSLKLIKILILLFLILPRSAYSAEILRDLEINLPKDQIYEKNLYVGAIKSFIEGTTKEDLIVFSKESEIVGDVYGDLFLLGGQIKFSGNVKGDLRVFGGNVKISGNVDGDVLIVGGNVEFLEGAKVKREIFVVGVKTDIKNSISEKLKIISGRVSIDAKILGSSDITTQNLKIGQNADISGDFSYYSPQIFDKNEKAVITGKVSFNEINSIREMGIVKKAILSFMNFWIVLKFLTTLILAFILIYIFKPFTQNVVDLISKSYWKSILVSLLILFLAPLAITILIFSLVGLPIGLLLFMGFIFIIIIAPAIAGIFIGYWVKKYFAGEGFKEIDFQSSSIGVIILSMVQLIPYAGGIIGFILFLISFGAISRQIRLSILK